MSPGLADVTGPHAREPEPVTFSWLRSWTTPMIAAGVFLAGLMGSWYALRAEDRELRSEAKAVEKRVETVEQRAVVLEAALSEVRQRLENIDRKQDRLLCKLFPADCKP